MKFGENLKLIRKSKNISQEELAERLGVSRQSVSKWETGENYPTMFNIMCLCDIFKCKINEIVHEDFEDINSLDEEIKMSVVKFKKDKQRKMKALSKILYVVAKIGEICLKVGIGFIALIMICIPMAVKSIDVEGDSVKSSDGFIKLVKDEKGYAVSVSNIDNVYVAKVDEQTITYLIEAYDIYSKPVLIGILETGFAVLIGFMVCVMITLKNLNKLFVNIYNGDTPFTRENSEFIKKMSYFMIASIILSVIGEGVFDLIHSTTMHLDLDLFNVMEIVFLFAISYIFEYGYEIQLDSKGKIYGDIDE